MMKMKEKIPPSQAAYLPCRGTMEQVFSIKIMAEKPISSSNYEINALLFDVSKAIDIHSNKIFLSRTYKSTWTRQTPHLLPPVERCRDTSTSQQDDRKILHDEPRIISRRLGQRFPLYISLSCYQFLSSKTWKWTSYPTPWIYYPRLSEEKPSENRSSLYKLPRKRKLHTRSTICRWHRLGDLKQDTCQGNQRTPQINWRKDISIPTPAREKNVLSRKGALNNGKYVNI